MIFNPDLIKQAQELYPCLSFNGIPLKKSISLKHLGLTTLEVKLNFVEYLKNVTEKISKTLAQISTNPTKIIPTDYI